LSSSFFIRTSNFEPWFFVPGYDGSQRDLIIAATALHHGLTIVSRDTSEYELTKAAVLNPWSATV
jgi:predicted nucleic acid-binding protein